MKRSAKALILLPFLLLSCKKDKQDIHIDFGYNYRPLTMGTWVLYEVDSIVYDPFKQSADTYNFFIREDVVETFEDLEGRGAFRFEQYYCDNAGIKGNYRKTLAWTVQGVRAERLEGNHRTVALTFPPKAGQSWDGNALNNLGTLDFEYDYVDEKGTVQGQNFDSTLRILHIVDTNNFIFREFSEERYARNAGLIYKEYFTIETQFEVDSGLHWIQRIVAPALFIL